MSHLLRLCTLLLLAAPASGADAIPLKGHDGWVGAIAFSPDGRTVATGSADRTVHLWNAATGQLSTTLPDHSDTVSAVAFSPDGLTLAAGGFDGSIRLWPLGARRERPKVAGHRGAVQALAFAPGRKLFASGGLDATVRLWDTEKGTEVDRLTRHKSWVNAVVFSPDGRLLATGSSDGTVKLWDVDSREELHTFDHGKIGEVRSLAISPDGKTLAAGLRYGFVKLHDVPGRREIATLQGHAADVWGVAFLHGGKTLASGDGDWNQPGDVKLWDVGTRTELRTLKHTGEVLCLAGAPDSRRLAAGGWDKNAVVWNLNEPALAARLDDAFRPPPELANDLGGYRSPLLFNDGTPVRTPEDWAKRRKEILKTWHDLMGRWPPEIEKPKLELLDREEQEGLTRRKVRIEVAPGRTTEDAYLLIPAGKGPFPAVLVVYYDAATGVGLAKKSELRDFALQLAKRGFVTLSLGSPPASFYPSKEKAQLQPLSYHAYVAANCRNALASLPQVDPERIGVTGHSYGGKWAMFASCLNDKFACAAWSDGGIVFDEKRSNVNYWEPWYLGHEPGVERARGIPSAKSPRTGAYRRMMETGRHLHELHALMAPRPFLVSGGSEDPPERWKALNHTVAVNKLLGYEGRVAMTNRKTHGPTPESNEQLYQFFERFLKPGAK